MRAPRRKARTSGITAVASLLILMIALSLFGLHQSPALQLAGRALFYGTCILVMGLLGLILLLRPTLPRIAVRTTAVLLVITGIYAANFIYAANVVSLRTLIQMIIVTATFTFFVMAGAAQENTGLRAAGLTIFLLLAAFAAAYLPRWGQVWDGGFLNPNAFGLFAFTMFTLSATLWKAGGARKRHILAALILASILIYASASRASALALVMMMTTIVFWGIIARYRILSDLYFLGVLVMLAAIVHFAIGKDIDIDILREMNAFSREYFGKNLESGRAYIWEPALDLIMERPWLGWGTQTLPGEALDITLSLHNWYLTVLYQTGAVGMGLFVLLFYTAWNVLRGWSGIGYGRIAAGVLVGTLFTQSFEVSLTQNNLNFGIAFWAVLGLVLGRLGRLDAQTIATARATT